jgi:hypothetical protein
MTKDDLRKMAKVFRDYNNPDNEGNLADFACQVSEAVKREDAERCDMYIRLLDACGHTADADEVRHLQRHFIEDADDLKREIYGEPKKEAGG